MRKYGILILCAFFLLSCRNQNFNQIRENKLKLVGDPKVVRRLGSGIGSITCSMDGGTMDDVLKLLPPDVSVCMSEELRFSRICLDVVDLDIESFLFAVSQSLNCQISRYGTLFVFSKSPDGGKGVVSSSQQLGSYVFYFRLPYYNKEEVVRTLGASVVFVSGDSYVFRGTIGEVVKIRELIDNMLVSLPCEYAFELFFVSREKLLNVSLVADLKANLNNVIRRGAGGLSVNEWSAVVQAVSSFTLSRSDSTNCRHICGVFREGSDYVSNIGDMIPYVKRVVQENGSSYDSDVQYIEIGTRIKMACAGEKVGIVNLDLEVNETTGYVQNYPQKRGSTIKTSFYVGGDERRFVGSFYVDGKSRSLLGVDSRESEWLVFCRVLRVSVGQRADFCVSLREKSEKKLEKGKNGIKF